MCKYQKFGVHIRLRILTKDPHPQQYDTLDPQSVHIRNVFYFVQYTTAPNYVSCFHMTNEQTTDNSLCNISRNDLRVMLLICGNKKL